MRVCDLRAGLAYTPRPRRSGFEGRALHQRPGTPIETLEGDLTNSPAVAAQGKANLIFLGQKLADVGFVVAEGNLFAALTAGGAYQDFGPAADIYDVSAILNPDTGLGNVLANFTDPKADGRT